MDLRHPVELIQLDSILPKWLFDCMPYADVADWKKSHAQRYVKTYRTDRKFRLAEAARKADWYSIRASDPKWLAAQAAKKRAARAAAKKKITKKS